MKLNLKHACAGLLAASSMALPVQAAITLGGVSLGPTATAIGSGTTVDNAVTSVAATNSYFIVGITSRVGGTGTDLDSVTMSISGGTAITLSELANGVNNNGNAEVWGVAVRGVVATSDIDFTFDYVDTETPSDVALSILQLVGDNPIAVLDSLEGAPNGGPYAFTAAISADDFVFANSMSRDRGGEAFNGTIGTPTSSNEAPDIGGNSQHLAGYWDNAAGAGLTIGSTTSNGNGGFAAVAFTDIPEPASLALMGLGGLLMLGRARRV